MNIKKMLLLCILFFLLASCQSATESQVTQTAIPFWTATAIPQPSTTPTLCRDRTVPILTPTVTSRTPVPSPDPSSIEGTSEVRRRAYHLYSPLAEHSIKSLFEIISSPYDPPDSLDDDARHHGVDFCYYQGAKREFIEGEEVQAIFSGLVVASIEDRNPYGNMVILETTFDQLPVDYALGLEMRPGESLYHLYAHLVMAPEVTLGEWVEGGQVLGQVGKTGYNLGVSHLHLETRIGSQGAVFENMAWFETDATQAEKDNYQLWRTSGTFRHFDPMTIFQIKLDIDPVGP